MDTHGTAVVDAAPTLPTEFTLGDRTYELVPFLKEGESYIRGNTVVGRAKKLNANLGQDDSQFILEHQDEIPRELQGKFYLVFAGLRDPSDPESVAYLDWNGCSWYLRWSWFVSLWDEYVLLVRRRPSTNPA